jgi:hypothetical protein
MANIGVISFLGFKWYRPISQLLSQPFPQSANISRKFGQAFPSDFDIVRNQ